MTKPLRILQICAGFSLESLGGVERYTFDLSRALRKLGAEMSIAGLWRFSTESEQVWMRRLNDEGICTYAGARKDDRAPLRNLFDSIRQIRSALSSRTFDVVHSQQEFGDVAAILLKPTMHARVLARSVHNDPEWRSRPMRRLLLTHLAAPIFFQAESGITQRIANRLNSRPVARLLGRHATVIHNAIDLTRFAGSPIDKQEARKRLGWPADKWVVGSVGRLSEQKGYIYLVRAAAQVREQMPNVCFRIVGAGELRDKLQLEIDSQQLHDTVILDGTRSNMNDVYAGMDVFASSSLWEGLPTVILEAMTAGTPVVATAVDGTMDLVIRNQTGLLAEPHSPGQLAEAITKMLQDEAFAAALVQNARATAATYHINRSAECWLEQYQALTEEVDTGSTQVNQ